MQEAVQSRAALVQFHALGLLHQVKFLCGFQAYYFLSIYFGCFSYGLYWVNEILCDTFF